MKKILILTLISFSLSCNTSAQKKETKETFSITKTDAEWKTQLTDLQYYVLREAGTERAFTSPLDKNYEAGVYVCSACETPLFKSENKFDSGTGWPSFDLELKGNVSYSSGNEYYGIEEHCSTCGGHLGHVFNDGPKETTGQRHCINGAALKFIPKTDD